VSDLPSNDPEYTPLTRTQVLIAMGMTAVFLMLVSKLWLQLGATLLLPLHWQARDLLLGIGLGVGITLASSAVYAVWAAYRYSADYYLEMVLKPLVFPDLIWLGLLPGLSEELLFRGVMLPAFGADLTAIVFSSLCFGVLHLSSLRQWPYVIWATLVGAALAISALLTQNLLVPMVAHVVTNFVSGCLWKWDEHKKAGLKH
jgi:membrane protease YdiL (CAAX protease family)